MQWWGPSAEARMKRGKRGDAGQACKAEGAEAAAVASCWRAPPARRCHPTRTPTRAPSRQSCPGQRRWVWVLHPAMAVRGLLLHSAAPTLIRFPRCRRQGGTVHKRARREAAPQAAVNSRRAFCRRRCRRPPLPAACARPQQQQLCLPTCPMLGTCTRVQQPAACRWKQLCEWATRRLFDRRHHFRPVGLTQARTKSSSCHSLFPHQRRQARLSRARRTPEASWPPATGGSRAAAPHARRAALGRTSQSPPHLASLAKCVVLVPCAMRRSSTQRSTGVCLAWGLISGSPALRRTRQRRRQVRPPTPAQPSPPPAPCTPNL